MSNEAMKFPRAREATKAETRDALIAAGAVEFAAKGVEGPSLDAICARAGFTRGAFYVHFRDRDDLLVAVIGRILTSFHDTVIAAENSPGDLEQTIARFLAAIAAESPATHGRGHWHFHDTLAACARIPKVRERYLALQLGAVDRLATAARAGQRAKTVRNDVPADTMGQILILLTLGIGAALEIGMPIDFARGGAALKALLAEPTAKKKISNSTSRKKKKNTK
jgi:TetR/AcrR family transcriptional regulator, transcriptional repressor for nem operon